MADINIDGLSLPEAEEAIVEIWSCLEEYHIPSPAMSVDVRANSRVTIGLSFEEPLWAELVSLRLSNSMRIAQLRRRLYVPVVGELCAAPLLLLQEEARTHFRPINAPAAPLDATAPTGMAESFPRAKRR